MEKINLFCSLWVTLLYTTSNLLWIASFVCIDQVYIIVYSKLTQWRGGPNFVRGVQIFCKSFGETNFLENKFQGELIWGGQICRDRTLARWIKVDMYCHIKFGTPRTNFSEIYGPPGTNFSVMYWNIRTPSEMLGPPILWLHKFRSTGIYRSFFFLTTVDLAIPTPGI